MELITRTLTPADDNKSLLEQSKLFHEEPVALFPSPRLALDETVLAILQRWSIPVLRVALGLVFLWFGVLKVLGVSPITPMLRETYTFLAAPPFVFILGIWEALIGIGLMFKLALRSTLCVLCLHLAGTFVALGLAPSHFFVHANPLVLTVDGEFVVKNVVLLASGLVIGANEVGRPFHKTDKTKGR